jgi:hypothetical protein
VPDEIAPPDSRQRALPLADARTFDGRTIPQRRTSYPFRKQVLEEPAPASAPSRQGWGEPTFWTAPLRRAVLLGLVALPRRSAAVQALARAKETQETPQPT